MTDGNPNGDPDAGNLPALDPQTLQGLVTDGCLKRKIRNAIAVARRETGQATKCTSRRRTPSTRSASSTYPAPAGLRRLGLDRREARQRRSEDRRQAIAQGEGATDNGRKARDWMCQNFYDIRAFGAVMTTGVNCGQVRGPVQFTFARSIDPIVPLEFAITRKSVTTEDDAKDSKLTRQGRFGITGTMGRKNTVPYGLYRCSGFVNPYLAKDTGFTTDDLQMLWDVLKGRCGRSTARPAGA